jgi:ATP-binding cassette subfamily C (CFTR/MRP) protein 1
MAHSDEEKDMKELDPIGIATNSEMHPDQVAEARDDSSEDEVAIALDHEKNSTHHQTKDLTTANELSRTRTDATGVTEATEASGPTKDTRSRWKRWNPLKRKPPPVPETRGVSREYTANFWSMLTFQWVTPIMSVSLRV